MGKTLEEKYVFGSTGATFTEKLTYGQWRTVLERAVGVNRAGPWVVGDTIKYGENAYGEKYTQAVAETGLSPERLRILVWVCSRFEHSRRRGSLSFESHREVASLEGAEQEEWLDRAERNRWTSQELRQQLRQAGAGNRAAGKTTYEIAAKFDTPLSADEEEELKDELYEVLNEFEPDERYWRRKNG